jgi:hypothetical protein
LTACRCGAKSAGDWGAHLYQIRVEKQTATQDQLHRAFFFALHLPVRYFLICL